MAYLSTAQSSSMIHGDVVAKRIGSVTRYYKIWMRLASSLLVIEVRPDKDLSKIFWDDGSTPENDIGWIPVNGIHELWDITQELNLSIISLF